MKKLSSMILAVVVMISISLQSNAILFAAEMSNEGVGILSNKAVSYEESEELPLNTFPTNEEINRIIEEEQPLVDAYQELIDNFSVSNGEREYPAYYAGNGFATGVIIYTDRAVNYSGTGYVHGLVHVTVETSSVGNCGGGDSGGCIYRGHNFYGTYSGDNRNPSTATNATTFFYSPIYGVRDFFVQTK